MAIIYNTFGAEVKKKKKIPVLKNLHMLMQNMFSLWNERNTEIFIS